jgi:hypothetical protein
MGKKNYTKPIMEMMHLHRFGRQHMVSCISREATTLSLVLCSSFFHIEGAASYTNFGNCILEGTIGHNHAYLHQVWHSGNIAHCQSKFSHRKPHQYEQLTNQVVANPAIRMWGHDLIYLAEDREHSNEPLDSTKCEEFWSNWGPIKFL